MVLKLLKKKIWLVQNVHQLTSEQRPEGPKEIEVQEKEITSTKILSWEHAGCVCGTARRVT